MAPQTPVRPRSAPTGRGGAAGVEGRGGGGGAGEGGSSRRISRMRITLIFLCLVVVASGLVYSSRLGRGTKGSGSRARMAFEGAISRISELQNLSRVRGEFSRLRNLTAIRELSNSTLLGIQSRLGRLKSTWHRLQRGGLNRTSRQASSHSSRSSASRMGASPVSSLRPEVVRQPWPQEKPRLILVTPTFPRAFQAMYFTRLTDTLRSVAPPLLWVVVESPNKTEETAQLLQRTAGRCLPLGRRHCRKIDYVHLATGAIETAKWNKAVVQRNRGLNYTHEHRLSGVVYFMDDDNSYSPRLFEDMRQIQKVGVFPVGFLFDSDFSARNKHLHHTPIVERPLVRANKATGRAEVYGWETFEWFVPKKGFKARRFNVDMAGFAFRSDLMWQKEDLMGFPKQPVRFRASWMGFLEDTFLSNLVAKTSELEPLANNCSNVWVWHAHHEAQSKHKYPHNWVVPQPKALVRIVDDDSPKSRWPFIVDKKRHGIPGRPLQGEQFLYE